MLVWYALVWGTRDGKAKTTVAAVVKPTVDTQKSSEALILEKPVIKPVPVVAATKEKAPEPPKIILDTPRMSLPPTEPQVPSMPQKIVIPTAPMLVDPSPATKTTDKPFMPEVPPLQPIPIAPIAQGANFIPKPAAAPTLTPKPVAVTPPAPKAPDNK